MTPPKKYPKTWAFVIINNYKKNFENFKIFKIFLGQYIFPATLPGDICIYMNINETAFEVDQTLFGVRA